MITAAVALVPRLDCRYRSLSQQLEIVSFPDFSSRYRTALSAIVALTSTPTRTKPPQAADLVPPSSTTTYELLRSRLRMQVQHQAHHKPAAKQWYRTCTAFCAFLISMPVPAQANATTRPARRFIKRTSLSPNNPHARTRHLARWGELQSSDAGTRRAESSTSLVALADAGHHTCALSLSAYARCSLPASTKDAVSLPRCHGSPGKQRAATNSSIAGSSALRAMTCMLQPFRYRLNGRALAQTSVPLSSRTMAKRETA